MVRECRPPAREPTRSGLVRRSTIATSTPANANSPANIRPVGPPPAISTACFVSSLLPPICLRSRRDAHGVNDTGISSLLLLPLLAWAGDAEGRLGSGRKPPGVLYSGSGRRPVLSFRGSVRAYAPKPITRLDSQPPTPPSRLVAPHELRR